MNTSLQQAIELWPAVAPIIETPTDDEQYHRLLKHLEDAMEIAGDNPNSPLKSLIESMASAAEAYEQQRIEEMSSGGIEALRYLMKLHNLKQSDLKEVGSQGVVSEILNGKRSLTVRHIRNLSRRFGVSPNTFF